MADDAPIDFQTTRWSMVLSLGDPSAMESLIRAYWRPVYRFVRSRGHGAVEAEDLTQSFFLVLLERGGFPGLEDRGTSFRAYLRRAVTYFLASDWRARTRAKRAPGAAVLGLERLEEEAGEVAGPPGKAPEDEFERQWARDVVRRARERLEADCRDRGRELAYRVFERHLVDGTPHADLAREFGLTASQVNNWVHRGKLAFKSCLRAEVAEYVSSEEDLERELADLRRILL